MAGAGNRELEAVDVKAFLISVGQKADKVVFLEAVGGEVGVEIAAGRSCNQSINKAEASISSIDQIRDQFSSFTM